LLVVLFKDVCLLRLNIKLFFLFEFYFSLNLDNIQLRNFGKCFACYVGNILFSDPDHLFNDEHVPYFFPLNFFKNKFAIQGVTVLVKCPSSFRAENTEINKKSLKIPKG